MEEDVKWKLGSVYFGTLGSVILMIGAVEIGTVILGATVEFGPIIISRDFLLWQGSILLFAGGFYISGVKNFDKIHPQARIVMGSIMIWVLAGMYLISTFFGSIPGGEGSWFNTWNGFLASYSAPYPPSLFILPFSLVVLYYLRVHSLEGDLAREEKSVKVGEDE